jgi:carbamoyl-phosphate synthase large subunit
MIMNDEIAIIINTVSDRQSIADAFAIRRQALLHKVTSYTTLMAARAAAEAHRRATAMTVHRLQDLHAELKGAQ